MKNKEITTLLTRYGIKPRVTEEFFECQAVRNKLLCGYKPEMFSEQAAVINKIDVDFSIRQLNCLSSIFRRMTEEDVIKYFEHNFTVLGGGGETVEADELLQALSEVTGQYLALKGKADTAIEIDRAVFLANYRLFQKLIIGLGAVSVAQNDEGKVVFTLPKEYLENVWLLNPETEEITAVCKE